MYVKIQCPEDPDCLGSSWASPFRMHWCLVDPDCLEWNPPGRVPSGSSRHQCMRKGLDCPGGSQTVRILQTPVHAEGTRPGGSRQSGSTRHQCMRKGLAQEDPDSQDLPDTSACGRDSPRRIPDSQDPPDTSACGRDSPRRIQTVRIYQTPVHAEGTRPGGSRQSGSSRHQCMRIKGLSQEDPRQSGSTRHRCMRKGLAQEDQDPCGRDSPRRIQTVKIL